MNLTLSINEQLVERAREKLRASGKSLNQEIRDHLSHLAGDSQLDAEMAFFEQTCGQGQPDPDWSWNRAEIYAERIR